MDEWESNKSRSNIYMNINIYIYTYMYNIYICIIDILMTSLLSGHTVKTNLMILCFTLILSTNLFSLPVIIPRNVLSFWMSQFL